MKDQKNLEQLRQIRTPTLYDAMEKFNVRPRTEGLMDPSMRPLLPSLGVMVGYATTAKVVGSLPPVDGERTVSSRELWQYVQRSPSPGVMVVQDLDQPSARSCAWGDVATSIFLQIGCTGDLIHGDEHGVMVVPKEISLEKLIAFVSEFLASEKTIVDYCKQPGFNIDKLCEVVDGHENRTTGHF